MKREVIRVTGFLEDDETCWPEIYESLFVSTYAPTNISAPILLEFNQAYIYLKTVQKVGVFAASKTCDLLKFVWPIVCQFTFITPKMPLR